MAFVKIPESTMQVKLVELTDNCIDKIADAVVRKLADRKTEPSNSEIPNNCEHITEDGVTCAKYPACDDCLDNPLNKAKGSERLVKGKDEPTSSKMEQVDEPQTCDTCKYGEDKHRYAHICNECGVGINNYEPKDESQTDKDFKVTYTCSFTDCKNFGFNEKCIECKRKQSEARLEDKPQADCAWK